MIQKVEMYQAVCDGCGKSYVNEDLGYCAWVDKESARENALESDTGWQEMIDGKLYCPDCLEYDEETDSYKPKEKKMKCPECGCVFMYERADIHSDQREGCWLVCPTCKKYITVDGRW